MLAVQSSNGIYTQGDRQLIQVEVSALVDEVDRIASQAEFNKFKLLLGDYARTNPKASMWFHMGANMHQRERVYIGTMTAEGLNLKERTGKFLANLSTAEGANRTIGVHGRRPPQDMRNRGRTLARTTTGSSSPRKD